MITLMSNLEVFSHHRQAVCSESYITCMQRCTVAEYLSSVQCSHRQWWQRGRGRRRGGLEGVMLEKKRERVKMTSYFKRTHEPSDWTWDASQLNAGPCGFAKKRHVGLNPMHFWNVEVIDQPSALWKCPLRPRSDLPPPSPSVFGVGSLCLSVNNMDIKGRKWKESRWVTGLSVAPLPL